MGGGVAAGLGFFAGCDVAGEDDDAVFKGTDKDFEPDVERRGIEGLELGRDAALHGGAVVGGEGLFLVGWESCPEVGADEGVALQDDARGEVSEGAVPVAVDADDGVGCALEDELELVGGGFAGGFGALAVSDLAVIEGDAAFERKDVDVGPDVEGRVVVLEALGDAGHGASGVDFELGVEGLGEDLPEGLAIDVGGCQAAESASLCVGEGDAEVAIEKDKGVWELFEQGVKS